MISVSCENVKGKLLSAQVEVAHDTIILLFQPTSHMVQVLRHLDTYKHIHIHGIMYIMYDTLKS